MVLLALLTGSVLHLLSFQSLTHRQCDVPLMVFEHRALLVIIVLDRHALLLWMKALTLDTAVSNGLPGWKSESAQGSLFFGKFPLQ